MDQSLLAQPHDSQNQKEPPQEKEIAGTGTPEKDETLEKTDILERTDNPNWVENPNQIDNLEKANFSEIKAWAKIETQIKDCLCQNKQQHCDISYESKLVQNVLSYHIFDKPVQDYSLET